LQIALRYDTLAWIQSEFLETEISCEQKTPCGNYLDTATPETLHTDFILILIDKFLLFTNNTKS